MAEVLTKEDIKEIDEFKGILTWRTVQRLRDSHESLRAERDRIAAAHDELIFSNQMWQSSVSGYRVREDELRAACDKLREEVAALRVDAERWKWVDEHPEETEEFISVYGGCSTLSEFVDQQIDQRGPQ